MPQNLLPGLEAPVPMPRGEKRRKTATSISNTQTSEPEPPKIRSLFPETWLWDIFSIGLVFKAYTMSCYCVFFGYKIVSSYLQNDIRYLNQSYEIVFPKKKSGSV